MNQPIVRLRLLTLLLFGAFAGGGSDARGQTPAAGEIPASPPAAPIRPVADVYPGFEITDPYRNLEDLDDPDTQAWMKAQSEHGRAMLDAIPERAAIRATLDRTDSLRPYSVGSLLRAGHERVFFQRRDGGGGASLYVRDGDTGEGRLLFDPSTFDRDGARYAYRRFGKGIDDLAAGIDSEEARAVRVHMASLSAEEFRSFIERGKPFNLYDHGTHVAGTAMDGNPAARLLTVRQTWPHTMVPPPYTRERAQRKAREFREVVAYLRAQGARVVNTSWRTTPAEIERTLEINNLGGDPEQRRREALAVWTIVFDALSEAIGDAPDILFVSAAGNSDDDLAFQRMFPGGIEAPNLLTVGAVDHAGDETSFTSHGRLVRVHANGYEVESLVPGGQRSRGSGTSWAAPQVTNLAAKLLALDPSLTVAEVVQLILDGAERSDDGRRNLINPKRSVELLAARRAIAQSPSPEPAP